MTRAMEKLILTYAESRRLYGQETFIGRVGLLPSLPPESIQEVRVQTRVQQRKQRVVGSILVAASHESFVQTGYQLGQRGFTPNLW